MDRLTFSAELVKALAWPVTVLLIFAVLRTPLLRLIPLLERLKYRELEVDFGRRLEEVASAAAALSTATVSGAATLPASSDLLRLVESSPRAAILEAWIRLEAAAIAAARRQHVDIPPSLLRSPHQLVQVLEETGVIDARQAAVFHELRGLRNSAAHASSFTPSPSAAQEYLRLAHALEHSLSEAQPSREQARALNAS
jgi:hypothetical protein